MLMLKASVIALVLLTSEDLWSSALQSCKWQLICMS